MYIVVEFGEKDGGGLAVVQKEWLTPRKKEVFWPPVKETKQFNKILQQSNNPDLNNWSIYSVSKIYYETGKKYTIMYQWVNIFTIGESLHII